MTCSLCGAEQKLVGQSHIIPDFMYKAVFDEKHRYMDVSLKDDYKPKLRQTGYHDKDILCDKCDNV